MCGIAGILEKNKSVNPDELRRMSELLSHRGPDAQGEYFYQNLGLAHTRLSIIDLYTGDQPLIDNDLQLSLIANGEIYNYIELREELQQQGCYFKTSSDSETIMHAYAAYGTSFLEKLNGMFSFALYDEKARKLILARDRLGIKPLYYAQSNHRVAFASEIKSLLPALEHSPQINPQALDQFFQNQFNTGRDTIIKQIKRILPGECLVIDYNLKLEHKQYWSPLSVAPQNCYLEEALEEFDLIFKQAIKEHTRSDVPYGLFLSGGVDSAVVLSMLNNFQDKQIRTFSIGYKDTRKKHELDAAQNMAKLFDTIHTPIALDKEDIFHRIPYSIWCTDDLMRDYSTLPTSFLAEEAARELKVVFTGEGGDEVFAGYGRYRGSFLENGFKALFNPGTGGFRTSSQIPGKDLQTIYGSELKSYINRHRDPFIEKWRRTPSSWDRTKKMQYTDMSTALPDNLLVKVDRILMGSGLEGRVPFLDDRVVEFGLSLPRQLKIKSNSGKEFLKRWGERSLPSEHLRQKKSGFHVPVSEWLTGDFVDSLEGKLLRNKGINQWFNRDGIKKICQKQRKKGSCTRILWSLMQFAIWHNLFIEGTEPKPGLKENAIEGI